MLKLYGKQKEQNDKNIELNESSATEINYKDVDK